jgi:hypothetical protein
VVEVLDGGSIHLGRIGYYQSRVAIIESEWTAFQSFDNLNIAKEMGAEDKSLYIKLERIGKVLKVRL